MEKPWHKVAKELLAAHDDLNITKLAERIGIGRSGLGHYLSGRRHPTPSMLKRIAKELNVSIAELVENDPIYARDDLEKRALEALRDLAADDKRSGAVAMLEALAKQSKQASDE